MTEPEESLKDRVLRELKEGKPLSEIVLELNKEGLSAEEIQAALLLIPLLGPLPGFKEAMGKKAEVERGKELRLLVGSMVFSGFSLPDAVATLKKKGIPPQRIKYALCSMGLYHKGVKGLEELEGVPSITSSREPILGPDKTKLPSSVFAPTTFRLPHPMPAILIISLALLIPLGIVLIYYHPYDSWSIFYTFLIVGSLIFGLLAREYRTKGQAYPEDAIGATFPGF